MVGIDVEDNSYIGVELEEVVFKLAGFADEDIACARLAASADAGEFPADISGEVDACGEEYLSYH